MARNIEIKAYLSDRAALVARLEHMADGPAERIDQDDVFFNCGTGRLKLRDFGAGRGELIAYARADQAGPAMSDYRCTATADPAGLRAALTKALGATGRVIKTRWLYRIGRTRVHVDTVAGLGDFIELEVVLAADEAMATGRAEADRLVAALAIEAADLCPVAYVDLLAGRAR